MLQFLRIRNLALLEEVSLDFEPGFTAVTGETGAGKSILLGALGLLAGARADKTIIRQGAAACEVEAALHLKDTRVIDFVLTELDLPACEEGVLLLKRTVPREKAPRITVNGGLATLAALQQLGEHWIDFHGPGEPRRLLKEECQRELLDFYARNESALEAYRAVYREWRGVLDERAELAAQTRLPEEQIAFLEAQIAKIDAVDPTDDSIEALERDFQRLNRSQELGALSQALSAGLTGDDGLLGRAAPLVREAKRLESLDPASAPLTERLLALSVEMEDLGQEFETLSSSVFFEADEAEELHAQMNAWLELKRRHGGSAASVRAARGELAASLSRHTDVEGQLARLDARAARLEVQVRERARELRSRREKASEEFSKAAAREIAQLGFKRTEFHTHVGALAEPGPHGDCGIEFLFSPNVGEAPLPLNRIASSGELARVMLALKTLLAEADSVPLLVFDEVDANVGGEIGRVVGAKMAALARRHQVLCVTHLPQVAAQAGRHLVVTKDQSKERAEVAIAVVHDDRGRRISELARMLGDRTAKAALAHAEELLDASKR